MVAGFEEVVSRQFSVFSLKADDRELKTEN